MVYHFNYKTKEYIDSNLESEKIIPVSGDIIMVDSGYSCVELMATYRPGCNGCYFDFNKSCLTDGKRYLNCSVNNVIFIRPEDEVIKVHDIKDRLCNPDVCMYYDDSCRISIPDNCNCILKIILR